MINTVRNKKGAYIAPFPWTECAKYFDAIHCQRCPRDNDFTVGWDCESTAWLNTKYLPYKGEVKIHRDDDDYYDR